MNKYKLRQYVYLEYPRHFFPRRQRYCFEIFTITRDCTYRLISDDEDVPIENMIYNINMFCAIVRNGKDVKLSSSFGSLCNRDLESNISNFIPDLRLLVMHPRQFVVESSRGVL